MATDYIDFVIEIDERGEGEIELSARSEFGEAVPRPRFHIDVRDIAGQLERVNGVLRGSAPSRKAEVEADADDSPQRALQEFGARLFDTIMRDAVAQQFRIAEYEAKQRSAPGVRIRLQIQSPSLAALPWEFMFDPGGNAFVCTSSRTPVVRYLEAGHAPAAIRVEHQLRVLVVSAVPSDQAPLAEGEEHQNVRQAFAELEASGRVTVRWVQHCSFDMLMNVLQEAPWHIVHFIGHGALDDATGEGTIMLQNGQGGSELVTASALRAALAAREESLRVVVLNSCEGALGTSLNVLSSTAATLIAAGIPAVVAMQAAISDDAAVAFATSIYASLAKGAPIDTAVCMGRIKLYASEQTSREFATPVLYMRSKSGALFKTQEHRAPNPPPTHANAPDVTPVAFVPASPAPADNAGSRMPSAVPWRRIAVITSAAASVLIAVAAFRYVNNGKPREPMSLVAPGLPSREVDRRQRTVEAVRLDSSTTFPGETCNGNPFVQEPVRCVAYFSGAASERLAIVDTVRSSVDSGATVTDAAIELRGLRSLAGEGPTCLSVAIDGIAIEGTIDLTLDRMLDNGRLAHETLSTMSSTLPASALPLLSRAATHALTLSVPPSCRRPTGFVALDRVRLALTESSPRHLTRAQ